MAASALKQTLFYGLALGLPKLIGFAMVPVTTHFLTPEDFGRLDVLQTLADVLGLIIAAGMADTLFRYGGSADTRQDRDRVGAELMGLSVAGALLVTLIGQLFAPWIAAALPGGIEVIDTRLLLLNLSCSGLLLISLSWLRLTDRAGAYLIAAVGRVGLQAGGAAIALILGYGITGVLAAGALAGGILATLLVLRQLKETGLRVDWGAWRLYLGFGGPLVLAGLAGFALGSFDRWILADIIGPGAMAIYAVAVKFALMTALLVQPFELWWLPRRFKVLNGPDGQAKAARLTGIGVVIACAAAVALAWGAPALIRLLTPDAYHAAVYYLPGLALISALHAVTQLLNFGFHAAQKTGRIALIDGVAAGLVLGLYLVLIPLYGIAGAIIATLTAQSVRLAATIIWGRHTYWLPFALGRFAILGGISTGLVLLVPGPDGFWAAVLQTLVGLAVLAFLAVTLRLVPLPTAPRMLRRRAAP